MGAIAIHDAEVASSTELRLRAAALQCIERAGLTRTTVDDIARAAGVSRATVYRHFPGGKETVVDALVGQEVRRFFADLAVELTRHGDAEALLVAGIGRALRFLEGHAALRAVLAHEPALLVTQVATHRLAPVIDAAVAFAVPYLRAHVADGPDADRRAEEVAELVVRVVLSYSLAPSRRLDPHDDESVARLVRTHLLPALRAESPSQPRPPRPGAVQ